MVAPFGSMISYNKQMFRLTFYRRQRSYAFVCDPLDQRGSHSTNHERIVWQRCDEWNISRNCIALVRLPPDISAIRVLSCGHFVVATLPTSDIAKQPQPFGLHTFAHHNRTPLKKLRPCALSLNFRIIYFIPFWDRTHQSCAPECDHGTFITSPRSISFNQSKSQSVVELEVSHNEVTSLNNEGVSSAILTAGRIPCAQSRFAETDFLSPRRSHEDEV